MIDKHQTIGGSYSVRYGLTNLILLAVMSVDSGELTNKYCPVTTSELAEEQFSIDYQGRTIYFCCNKCKKDFLSNPEMYLANLDSPVSDSDQPELSHDHGEEAHDHGKDVAEAAADSHKIITDPSHDHGTDHGDSSSLIGLMGKFHPMITHFPIALVMSALVFSILSGFLQNQTLDYVSVYSMYLAALTGIGTVIFGLAAGSVASYPPFLFEYFSWHRILGITTGIATILTALAGRKLLMQSSRGTVWSYRISLIVNAILVGITGHFGATLVFGPDYFGL